MAYQALYRTYRPSNFDEMNGQKHVIKTLMNAIKQKKIAHAYLLCGPRGTGKTSIARILAKAVNCTSDKVKPCNKCDNCIEINESRHADIVEIDAASNNGVDEIRDLIEKVKFSPSLGKYKVYIIDEVHMLSTGAFNALLKTLEEPPSHVIFIMATTDPQKVLPTIISRCQRFDFGKLSEADIKENILSIAKKEKIKIDDASTRLIASLADGGMRDALSILDQCIAYTQSSVTIDIINDIYGITTIEEKINLLKDIKDKDITQTLERFNKYVDKGIDIKRLCNDIMDILKESIIYELSNHKYVSTILNETEMQLLNSYFTKKQSFKMIDDLLNYNEKFKFATNINNYFELCLLKLICYDETDIRSEQSVVLSSSSNKKREEKEHIEPSVTKKLVTLNEKEVINLLVQASKEDRVFVTKKWEEMSSYFINDKYRSISKLLVDGVIMASNEDFVLISTPYKQQASLINDEVNCDIKLALMRDMLGKERMVFALSNTDRDKAISTFKVLSANKELPPPLKINVKSIKEEEVIIAKDDIESKLENIFGELLEIQED